ncbi:hypothetical protein LTR50_002290 [Elasticomyces elasticus]|nr:hypothetical protein LTR50_002290 [Elasticomyces elasticus]
MQDITAKRHMSDVAIKHDPDNGDEERDAKRLRTTAPINPQNPQTNQQSAILTRQPPYQEEEQEPMPRLPAYSEIFGSIESQIDKLCRSFVKATAGFKTKDKEFHELVRRSERYRKVHYPEQLVVAFMGGTDTGKSSVINSLLNVPLLAPQGGTGDSCTCVVQEFAYSLPEHHEPFRAEVYYFVPRKIEGRVKKYFRDFYLARKELAKDPNDIELRQDMEEKESTAFHFFMSLFCDRPQFQDEDTATRFLRSAANEKDPAMIRNLLQWIEELKSTLDFTAGQTTIVASTPEELNSKLARYRAPDASIGGESPLPSPWPVVRNIRIYLRSRILRHGMIIADTPGITDTNQIKRDATLEYVDGCDISVIVNRINRALCDPVSHKMMIDCFRRSRNGKNKVMMICTRSDCLEEKEIGRTRNDQIALLPLQKKVSDWQEMIDDAQADKDAAQTLEESRRAEAALKSSEIAKAQAEAKIQEYHILARNEFVKLKLRQKWKSITRDKDAADLPVFCVSNTEFCKHLEGYSLLTPPRLTAPNTGIPEVRHHLYTLPATAKFNHLWAHTNGLLMELVGGWDCWCNKEALERKEKVADLITGPLDLCKVAVDDLINSIRRLLENDLLPKIRARESHWVRAARTQCRQWGSPEEYKAVTYKAFCRRHGSWKRPRETTKESWNKILIEITSNDVAQLYANFQEDVNNLVAEFLDDREKQIQSVIDSLKGIM